jgi:hypothetical protein
VKDNKNHHLLTFLFLLIAKDVFEEVQLGFLIIDHTHEDMMAILDIFPKN